MGLNWGKVFGVSIVGAVLLGGMAASILEIEKNAAAENFAVSGNKLNSQIISLSLFTDVENWTAPDWSLEENAVTGVISRDTGVMINSQVPAQDADMQLSLMLMKNRLPDLITISDPDVIRQLVSSGKVWKLDDLFAEYKPDAKVMSNFSPETIQELKLRDGGWYSIPSGYSTEDLEESPQTIIWNKSILKRLGYTEEDVRTKTQVLAVLRRVASMHRQHKSDIIPLLLDGKSLKEGVFKFLSYSFGAYPVDKNGIYQNIWLTDGGKEALMFVNQLLRNGSLDSKYLSYSQSQIKLLMESNEVLCYMGDISHLSINPDEWLSSGPILSSSQRKPVLCISSGGQYGWANTFISKSCTDLRDATDFIDYMMSGQAMEAQQDAPFKDTEWWLFQNPLWDDVKTKRTFSATESRKIHELRQTYSKADVRKFDGRLLTLPKSFYEQEGIQALSTKIDDYETKQIAVILAADTENTFLKEYKNFEIGLIKIGYVKYKSAVSKQIAENEKIYGEKLIEEEAENE